MLALTIGGQNVKIDPARLSATARTLAEAIANTPGRTTVDIWMEADQPIRDTQPDWANWHTEDEAAQPERRPWRGWSTTPLGPAEDPHARIEYEARKIPPGWHVYGARPDTPNTDRSPVREGDTATVLAYLAQHGRTITPATWRAYVARNQAPQPAKRVGRTPLWHLDDIDTWLGKP